MFRTLGDMIRKTQKYLLLKIITLIKNTYITDNIRTLPPKQRFVEVGQLASENKEGISYKNVQNREAGCATFS